MSFISFHQGREAARHILRKEVVPMMAFLTTLFGLVTAAINLLRTILEKRK